MIQIEYTGDRLPCDVHNLVRLEFVHLRFLLRVKRAGKVPYQWCPERRKRAHGMSVSDHAAPRASDICQIRLRGASFPKGCSVTTPRYLPREATADVVAVSPVAGEFESEHG